MKPKPTYGVKYYLSSVTRDVIFVFALFSPNKGVLGLRMGRSPWRIIRVCLVRILKVCMFINCCVKIYLTNEFICF